MKSAVDFESPAGVATAAAPRRAERRVERPRPRKIVPPPLDELGGDDVRKRLDEAVLRGWSDATRRILRVVTLVSIDAMASVVSVGLAMWIEARFASVDTSRVYAIVVPLLGVQALAFAACGSFQSGKRRVSPERVGLGLAVATGMVWMQAALMGEPLSVWFGAAYLGCAFALTLCGRVAVDRIVVGAQRLGWLTRRLLLVGSEKDATRLRDLMPGCDGRGIQIVQRISPEAVAQAGAFDRLAGLAEVLRRYHATGVLVAANLDFDALNTLTRRCFDVGASLVVVPQTLNQLGGHVELRYTRAGTMLELRPGGLRLPQLALKRVVDLLASVIGVILVCPLFAAIAIAIKLDSPGPIFFGQIRAGVAGRPFRMFKFRTMREDADAMKEKVAHLNGSGDPRLFKIKDDPRVTRVGRFLRKTSLDELPQLLNVLRGEMSLVGPRPFFTQDMDGYEARHLERLLVLPGITGLWQVSGRSDVVDFEEVVRLDSEYIRSWSLGLDLSILVRTIPAAMGRGAY